MKRFTLPFLSIVFLMAASISAHAQKVDSMINVYGEQFPQEKVHVHFDKAVYNPGETIWFKAYIQAGFMPSQISKNFYAELIDPSTGRMLQRKVMPVFESSTAGHFDLPVNLNIPEVVFRAYTNWMMNFDTTMLYTKTLRIVTKNDAGAAVQAAPPTLKFFPEGGDLIAGLATSVAFKATDSRGFPVKAKGIVRDAKGATVASFSSAHDGMGKFEFEPAAGATYNAEWKDEKGTAYKAEFPAVKSSGAVLQIAGTGPRRSFIVKRSMDAGPEMKKVYIVGHIYQQVVYKATIDLSGNFMTSGLIPTDNLPSGILQVTLFDANWKALAERITFVNNNDYLFLPDIVDLGKNLSKRGKNIISIEVPDTLRSNLSISVTDLAVSDDGKEDIFSRFLLSDELKGFVYQPAYYFSSTADSVQQHLDLVMLTNGWRRFKWEDLAQGKLPQIKYPLENYLALKGELTGLQPSQIPQGTLLNVFMETKDSSRQLFLLPVDNKGKFKEEGLVFFDTVKLYYSFNKNEKLTTSAVVNFNNGSLRSPSLVTFNPGWRIYNPIDSNAIRRSQFIAAEADRLRPEIAKRVRTLETVTVTAKQKSKTQLLDQKYASGLFSGGDAYSFDMMDDPFAMGARDIFTFLQGRVPGLMINGAGGPDGPTLQWRGQKPTLFLNEMQIDASAIANTPVADVAYVKVFRPPFFGAFGGGAGGAIAVYTKKGGDMRNTSNVPGGMEKNRMVGYSAAKEFYSPDYSKENALYDVLDVRTTLYWAPYLLTDKNSRKATITFYNNDISKKLKVIVEGMNEAGMMTRVEKVLE
ncbi:hypothetical protein HHL16_07190 [Pseudoflavitalea sp. G-6-1-2]|uniref:hypothetical protein n=1 Tax=Pseudoflavitalea sp. G-6-1-2 TaxID=2728841 RepID=UPI00146BA421|nr:hypothetical protein [Pseudoflavitalea sp. G-6-1-2]NML20652.1 hypothetical protein [Pseudoflavitalea sp. G-6-1-2]